MTDQARCSKLISAICSQLEEFGAMTFDSASRKKNGWYNEAKSNERAIIEGANAYKGRPSAIGKFWELQITATKPPDVTLVDMVMYKEISAKSRARKTDTISSKEMKPKEGLDRKPSLTI